MSRTHSKRRLSSTDRGISPPAVRRKVLTDSDSTPPIPGRDELRIYSWNVNGVNPLLQKQLSFQHGSNQSTNPLRTFLQRHHWPHFLCLQEVKISPRDKVTQRRLQSAANEGTGKARTEVQSSDTNLAPVASEPIYNGAQTTNHDHTYTIHFSLPRDKFNATGFGGKVHGVATLIRDDVAVKYGTVATSRPEWDLEGRVLVHTLTNLSIVNGYWPNGTSNPYRNSSTGSLQGTRHDYKLRFHEHMLELAKSMTGAVASSRHVLLVGDMNVARSTIDGHPNLRTSPVQHVKNRADFNSKFFSDGENGFAGADVFREIHGGVRKYTYHPRGRKWGESCDRVDLIIADRALMDTGAVTDADICDNARDRGHSDHVPLWATINMPLLSEKMEFEGKR